MFTHVEKIAAMVDKHGKDCKKLTEELDGYAKDHLAEIEKIRTDGGGKIAVLRAMETKYSDKLDAAIEKIEDVEFECKDKKLKKLLGKLSPS